MVVGAPDLTTSLPVEAFEFTAEAGDEARAILVESPDEIFHRMLRHQESESALLCARIVIDAFLGRIRRAAPSAGTLVIDASVESIVELVGEARADLDARIKPLTSLEPGIRHVVLRQRAPLALIAGCWLDTVSQPATQPAVVVNRLLEHHIALKGGGVPSRSVEQLRRRALADAGVVLPEIDARDFMSKADARPLTAAHALFYVSLSKLPANFLPEVIATHYAVNALGVDGHLTGTTAPLQEPMLRDVLATYLDLTRHSEDGGLLDRRRLLSALRLVLKLEREHVDMLGELATWHARLSLDERVAAIIQRHAPFAGAQHGKVRIGGQPLTEVFGNPNLDIPAFMAKLRTSRHVRSGPTGSRFLAAIKFGGPMFGIFDTDEAATLRAWVHAVDAGAVPTDFEVPVNRAGDTHARAWINAIAASRPPDVVFTGAREYDHRQLFHRLVNIENFAHLLPTAKAHADRLLADAEILFVHGGQGRYTDASWLDYSPRALIERVDEIYWQKLINPYRPLDEVPDREEVIAGQRAMALENLIDGSWLCRIGNLGRYRRASDAILLSIYLDEMGQGELRKNHVALIKQVLGSMSIRLPHIRDRGFVDQRELPDTYDSSIYQLCLSLFPDSRYAEILGYNLGIESTGPGELRMHEIQKLRHHGLDTAYEDVHLTIDNLSAGHARQATEAIIAYLDGVERDFGDDAVRDEWRRIWRGYASFAYFMEDELVRSLRST